ncbi:hypothetical protein [Burkholderia mayonis]|uniref:hypothetical protein n=1 Tax=Burkholderia mayonis TaxID=1385591 RepID=UPI00131EF80C|nr:hypothetical protein [Burkholderia mayonis]
MKYEQKYQNAVLKTAGSQKSTQRHNIRQAVCLDWLRLRLRLRLRRLEPWRRTDTSRKPQLFGTNSAVAICRQAERVSSAIADGAARVTAFARIFR